MEVSDQLKLASPPDLSRQLPSQKWFGILEIRQWDGFWYLPTHLEGAMRARSHFEARHDDVLLAGCPKTGTTWLKALIACIMNRNGEGKQEDDDSVDPLLNNHPNAFMPSLELQICRENQDPDLAAMVSPRLFRTHLPYTVLPQSVTKSDCKIVYIARDPKDAFVSLWHFIKANRLPEQQQDVYPITDAFESFCRGHHPFGPFHDHVLGYWKESLKRPEKILFLKYEEMKRDTRVQVKKLASFLGKPFVNEQELDKVIWRCSLDRLKNLEVNKSGTDPRSGMAHKTFFRLGLVGDWRSSLSTEMKERLDEITRKKLEGSGLDL